MTSIATNEGNWFGNYTVRFSLRMDLIRQLLHLVCYPAAKSGPNWVVQRKVMQEPRSLLIAPTLLCNAERGNGGLRTGIGLASNCCSLTPLKPGDSKMEVAWPSGSSIKCSNSMVMSAVQELIKNRAEQMKSQDTHPFLCCATDLI